MNRLPFFDRAIVPREKLTEYALNPSHPVGKDKARVFRSMLGITLENHELLEKQILSGVKIQEASRAIHSQHGAHFTVLIPVTGPRGSAIVTTAWVIRNGEDFPQLTSLYIDTKRKT